MQTNLKPALSLGALVLFGLSLSCSASASEQYRTNEQIRNCVSAIGEQADYGGAERIVHTVTRLRQRNYAELEIRVDTEVFGKDDVRAYAASCVSDTFHGIVRLRVNAVKD